MSDHKVGTFTCFCGETLEYGMKLCPKCGHGYPNQPTSTVNNERKELDRYDELAREWRLQPGRLADREGYIKMLAAHFRDGLPPQRSVNTPIDYSAWSRDYFKRTRLTPTDFYVPDMLKTFCEEHLSAPPQRAVLEARLEEAFHWHNMPPKHDCSQFLHRDDCKRIADLRAQLAALPEDQRIPSKQGSPDSEAQERLRLREVLANLVNAIEIEGHVKPEHMYTMIKGELKQAHLVLNQTIPASDALPPSEEDPVDVEKWLRNYIEHSGLPIDMEDLSGSVAMLNAFARHRAAPERAWWNDDEPQDDPADASLRDKLETALRELDANSEGTVFYTSTTHFAASSSIDKVLDVILKVLAPSGGSERDAVLEEVKVAVESTRTGSCLTCGMIETFDMGGVSDGWKHDAACPTWNRALKSSAPKEK